MILIKKHATMEIKSPSSFFISVISVTFKPQVHLNQRLPKWGQEERPPARSEGVRPQANRNNFKFSCT